MMTIEEFIEEYAYLCAGAEPQSDDIVKELYSEVSGMFEANCGTVPNFELLDGGKVIKLL